MVLTVSADNCSPLINKLMRLTKSFGLILLGLLPGRFQLSTGFWVCSGPAHTGIDGGLHVIEAARHT